MNTLVDFNAAKHTLKHGQKKEDNSNWMSLKDVAEMLNIPVPQAKALVQRAVASRLVKNVTKHGPRGMQILYAAEMAKEIQKLYASGALARAGRSRLFRFLPTIGQGMAIYSIGKTIVESKIGKAVIAKLELEKWEAKAEDFVDEMEAKYRPVIESKIAALPKNWTQLRTLAVHEVEKVLDRRAHKNDATKARDVSSHKNEKLVQA